MDIHQRSLRADVNQTFVQSSPERTVSSPCVSPLTELPSIPQKPAKRSFDVAFLMAPDDLSTKKNRQQQQSHLRLVTSASLLHGYTTPGMSFAPANDPLELKITRSLSQQRMLTGRTDILEYSSIPTSPLGLLIPSPKEFQKVNYEIKDSCAKSAFTKVRSVRPDGTPSSPASVSSGGGISPDVSYQESLSPPMRNSSRSPNNYLQQTKALNPNMAYFASGGKVIPPIGATTAGYFYGNTSKEKSDKPLSQIGNNGFTTSFINKQPIESMNKLRPVLYQGDGLCYGGISVPPYPFSPNFPSPGGPMPPHTLLTAAASVTAAALLPPSLAALTLPAQNVCAKCKISFRMTSDLVYHMRSHHKGEHVVVDSARRRRDQDKLRCPVCNETFRERHHLTRHMTAHQDKEGDQEDEDDALELTRRRLPQHK